MSSSNVKINTARGVPNETYSSRESLKKFMYLDEEETTKFIIYGTNNYSRYYATLAAKTVFPKIEFFVDASTKKINSLKGYLVKSKEEFIEYINLYKAKVKVIVFCDQYAATVKELQLLGLDPFKQIFDGRYIFDMREFDTEKIREADNINRMIFTVESYRAYKGGLFTLNAGELQYNKILEGDFRGLTPYKDGYIALDDKQGILCLNSDLGIEKIISVTEADLHGIEIYGDHSPYVFVAETAFDRIGIFNLETGVKEEQIDLAGKDTKGRAPGMYHINDILLRGDELLVSMLSIRGLFDRGAFKDDGAIVGLNIKNYIMDEVYAQGLNSPHSLIKVGNHILFCDSAKGEVYCDKDVIHKMNGYVRGLHFNGYSLYVGQNTPRHLPYLMQIASNFSNDTGIHSFIPSRRVSTFQPFPFVGQVYSMITE